MKPINDSEQWFLPAALDLLKNPSRAKDAREWQAQLAARTISPLSNAGPNNLEMARAVRMIEHLQQDYNRVTVEIGAALVTGEAGANIGELQDARASLAQRIAECLVTIGDYEGAAKIDPREGQRQVYRDIQAAIERDDSEFCSCPPGKDFVRDEVYSVRHGRKMPLRACGGCGTMNVASLPDHLARRMGHEERARRLVSGLSPADAARKLRSIGHTSNELLKASR